MGSDVALSNIAFDNSYERLGKTPKTKSCVEIIHMSHVIIGCWPRRMPAEIAAVYCGESSARAFLKRVGSEYPKPRVSDGHRRLWLKDDLDQAILPTDLVAVSDVAEDL